MSGRAWRKVSPEKLARILLLLREGVPPLWVAEDVGVERSTVSKLSYKYRVKQDLEWAAIQLSVRKDSKLAALHAEIAPRNAR